MIQERKATPIEKIRGWIYKLAWPFVGFIAIAISFAVFKMELMDTIIENATTLAVTGTGVAAFLFTVQSVLISVPKDNPFMQYVRKDGRYLVFIHRFCRTAEIGFLVTMIPMFYMDKEKAVLNIVVLSCFIGCLLLTIWSMFLMGKILIVCEKQSSR
jgi:hypothetical protein